MIDEFYGPIWAECHEKFAGDVSAGLARIGRWLRRRAKAKKGTLAVGRRNGRAERDPCRLQDQRRADHHCDDDCKTLGESETVNSMSSHENVAIAPEPATSAAAQYCLSEYYSELRDRFDCGFDPALSLLPSLDEFAPPSGTFLLVRLNGEPVGCGGLKPISREAAYLKRMWIVPGARRLGLARRLLTALEDEARAMGYSTVRLETNKSLIEAQQLYRSSGYAEVTPFNDERYAHHWFEKRLRQSTNGS